MIHLKNKLPASKTMGHLSALLTIGIWGTTFISTKLLLTDLSPIQLLFSRFLIGYLFLWLLKPKILLPMSKKEEGLCVLAGFFGITLYYFLENVALVYTTASNVGIAVSLAPFFTVILSNRLANKEPIHRFFYVGFLIALCGIGLISFASFSEVTIHPLGDLLGVLAAFIWSAYSIVSKKISEFGRNILLMTRRTFFYGLLFMLLLFMIMSEPFPNPGQWTGGQLANILFLGIGASAICFVTWNYSVRILGAVSTSAYIYAVPAITVVTSAIFLKEQLTPSVVLGTILTTMGLFLSEKDVSRLKKGSKRPNRNNT